MVSLVCLKTLSVSNALTSLILFSCQWDDPHVVPAEMSMELSELFSRELTRVTMMLLLSVSVF